MFAARKNTFAPLPFTLGEQERAIAASCKDGVVHARAAAIATGTPGAVEAVDSSAGRRSVGCQTTDTVGGLAISGRAQEGELASAERDAAGESEAREEGLRWPSLPPPTAVATPAKEASIVA